MNHNDPYLALALLPPRATPSRALPPRAKETMPTWKEARYGVGSAFAHGKCAPNNNYVMFT